MIKRIIQCLPLISLWHASSVQVDGIDIKMVLQRFWTDFKSRVDYRNTLPDCTELATGDLVLEAQNREAEVTQVVSFIQNTAPSHQSAQTIRDFDFLGLPIYQLSVGFNMIKPIETSFAPVGFLQEKYGEQLRTILKDRARFKLGSIICIYNQDANIIEIPLEHQSYLTESKEIMEAILGNPTMELQRQIHTRDQRLDLIQKVKKVNEIWPRKELELVLNSRGYTKERVYYFQELSYPAIPVEYLERLNQARANCIFHFASGVQTVSPLTSSQPRTFSMVMKFTNADAHFVLCYSSVDNIIEASDIPTIIESVGAQEYIFIGFGITALFKLVKDTQDMIKIEELYLEDHGASERFLYGESHHQLNPRVPYLPEMSFEAMTLVFANLPTGNFEDVIREILDQVQDEEIKEPLHELAILINSKKAEYVTHQYSI